MRPVSSSDLEWGATKTRRFEAHLQTNKKIGKADCQIAHAYYSMWVLKRLTMGSGDVTTRGVILPTPLESRV